MNSLLHECEQYECAHSTDEISAGFRATFGDAMAADLAEWYGAAAGQHRAVMRDLADLRLVLGRADPDDGFATLEATFERRLSSAMAECRAEIDGLGTRLLQVVLAVWIGTAVAVGAMALGMLVL